MKECQIFYLLIYVTFGSQENKLFWFLVLKLRALRKKENVNLLRRTPSVPWRFRL